MKIKNVGNILKVFFILSIKLNTEVHTNRYYAITINTCIIVWFDF